MWSYRRFIIWKPVHWSVSWASTVHPTNGEPTVRPSIIRKVITIDWYSGTCQRLVSQSLSSLSHPWSRSLPLRFQHGRPADMKTQDDREMKGNEPSMRCVSKPGTTFIGHMETDVGSSRWTLQCIDRLVNERRLLKLSYFCDHLFNQWKQRPWEERRTQWKAIIILSS